MARLKTSRGIRVATFLDEQETWQRKEQEEQRDHREQERLVLGAEGGVHAEAHGDVGTEIADADTDAADLAAIAFVADLGQHRVVELKPRLYATLAMTKHAAVK